MGKQEEYLALLERKAELSASIIQYQHLVQDLAQEREIVTSQIEKILKEIRNEKP